MAAGRAARLEDRAVLVVDGPEARPFLQGLLTADLDRLAPDRALWAALLTPQGRFLFDFGLIQDGGRVLLDAERGRLAELARRLQLYRLRAAVTIAEPDTPWTVLALPDAEALARLGLRVAPGACRPGDGGFLLVDPRLAALGVRAVLPMAAVGPFLARHGLETVGAEEWDRLRLALGVPDGSRDLVPEKALALESNFLELGVVSLAKGCFVGQELTARMAHRALRKWRLAPVRVRGPLPAPGTPVLLDDREVGEVRSGLEDRALALLRVETLASSGPGAGRYLRAGEAELEPALPVWMTEPPPRA